MMPEPILAFDLTQFLAGPGGQNALPQCRSKKAIFSQGEPAETIFYVRKGRVKLTVLSKDGREAVTGILVTGDFFGEGCLAGQPLRMSTAAVLGESIILRLEKKLIVRLLQEQPAFAAHFIKHLLARNIRIEEDLVDQILNSSEKRLARRLLLLADFENQPEPDAVVGRISQETLAAMIGTTRSRVSFFMNRFRKLGFIEYKGEIRVHRSLVRVVLND
jgi:CRP/FNR family cyclic AMP-dependent transcriptional regulator